MKKGNSKNNTLLSINERKNLDWLWLISVFLFSINLLEKGQYWLIGLFITALIIINHKVSKFKITIDLLLIFLFTVSYFIIFSLYRSAGMFTILVFLVGPIACFVLGYFIVKTDYNFIVKSMITISIGLFIHGFLNMLKYFQIYGFRPSISERIIPDIWTGVNIAATLQGTHYAIISSLLFYSIIVLKDRKHILVSSIIILATVLSAIFSFISGTRTLLVIIVINFCFSFLIYGFQRRKNYKEFLKLLFAILSSFTVVYLIYISNTFGIKDFVLNSTWYLRSETNTLESDPRMLFWKTAISQMFQFPFGGYRMGFSYAHNLWLDVLNATGLIPFFFLSIYTIKSFINLFTIIINEFVEIEFKIFIFSTFLGFVLQFMVEPILEGVPYMFLLFLLFNGMTKKYLDLCKSQKNSRAQE
ncbi:hypothetical protein NC797_03020 [Aquibacillus sp. 3ASR75-11]|uniref:Uncharacterized protein n=1 Tax=Terrihalobacillus insolitus TaxID=2950438 RepID=A0A9X3WNX4_9BACI|nr:hypothetical protein [Terrihalobacillus insolitus]MDC3423477.1 hypothetical protein [Terrihalobacillus insolitus]